MNFSVTERGSYRRCKRQAVLTSKNGRHLTKLFGPLHLSTGSIVHKAHQEWLLDLKKEPHERKSLYQHALDAAVQAEDAVSKNYLQKVGVEPSDVEMATTHEAIDFALKMCENYEKHWGAPLPDDYELINPEQKVRIPVEGTRRRCPNRDCRSGYIRYGVKCLTCDGTGEEVHYLEGKLDGLIYHTKTGMLDVLEHKTYGARPKQENLQFNDQFLAYAWLVRKLGVTDGIPRTAYDGMWRRAEVPARSKFENLFLRLLIPHTQSRIDEFDKFLPIELNEMADTYKNTHKAYINRQWQGCWDCGVESICAAMSLNADVESVIQAEYVERTDDTQEDENGSQE